ncbi:MAG TPA: hypothetical protein VE981_03015, partial [Planctomycetota bacterium]|nr:hypothetical protein [Planctomycetota bacterium]
VAEVHQSLAAGTAMSESLTITLKAFDAVLKRIDENKNPNAEPIRIAEVTRAAAQMEGTAKQLAELVSSVDRMLSSQNLANFSKQAAPAVDHAMTGARELMDAVFWRSICLVLAVLGASLIYRFAAPRLAAPPARTS